MNDNDGVEFVDDDLVEYVVAIVSAYVSRNDVSIDSLAKLMSVTYSALVSMPKSVRLPTESKQLPAVPVGKSVTPDHIVCLEDGKKFRTLKRHLRQLGMTPQEYREKWDLPSDYPLVAPSYSAKRSTLAKSNGLGRRRGAPPAASKVTVVDLGSIDIQGFPDWEKRNS